MKKISLIFCAVFVFMIMNISVYAEETEIIITADQMEWFNNENIVDKTGTLSPTGWGDGVHTPRNMAYNQGDNPKTRYDMLPTGMYRVWYYLPKNHESYDTGRSSRILDTNVRIIDKNETVDIISVKDYIYDEGYKDLGVFEFDETHRSIEITVNEDNKVIKGQFSPLFVISHIKLEPVYETNTELLESVNESESASDIQAAAETYGFDFIDCGALYNMDKVYEQLYTVRPQNGYSSSYHFKRVFEQCVDNQLTKATVPASSFVWQTSEANAQNNGWRINWLPIGLSHKENSNVAVATFRFANTDGIKRISLKTNYDKSLNKTENNIVITKYSGDVYENASEEKIQDKGMNNVVFTDLVEPKRLMLAEKDITDEDLIEAIKENGYLSLYMKGDSISYPDVNCGQLQLSDDCKLTVYYDLTYLGGKADLRYFDSAGVQLDENSIPVTTGCITVKHIEEWSFTDFDFLNYIVVMENNTVLPSTNYTVKKIDEKTVAIELKDGFKYDTAYKVVSEKYVKFAEKTQSYEFEANFNTEKYPAEFSGIKLLLDGKPIQSLEKTSGKTIRVEADIKNNTLPAFDAYLIVNLYERTQDGTKMLNSLVKHGNIAKSEALEMNGSFNIPETDGDYFVTACVWDGFETMNFIKMYNGDSYQKID